MAALGVVPAGTTRRASAAARRDKLTYGAHISLAPTWFDPAETPGIITPFMLLYALHDGMVKPMPAAIRRRAWRILDRLARTA